MIPTLLRSNVIIESDLDLIPNIVKPRPDIPGERPTNDVDMIWVLVNDWRDGVLELHKLFEECQCPMSCRHSTKGIHLFELFQY